MQTTAESLVDEVARFRQVREETLRLVEGLTQEELDRSPASGRWSIGEVLDHLLRAEEFFRRDLGRLVELSSAGRPGHIRHTFRDLDIGLPLVPRALLPSLELPFTLATLFLPAPVLNLLTGSRLFPMRHPSVADPRPGRPVEALRQELEDAGRRTEELLGRFSSRDAVRMTVSHPLLGTRNIPELVRFVVAHERRHQGQIAELKEGLKTPPGPGSVTRNGFGRPAVSPDVPHEHQAGDRTRWLDPRGMNDRRREMPRADDEDAIRGVYQRISEAWGRGDARGLVANFAPEGDLIDPFGRVARGRAAVEALLAGNFAGVFRGSQIIFDPQLIRFLTPEVAVADGTWQVTLPPQPPDGRAPPPIMGLLTSVFQKVNGAWKIEADRPMQKATFPTRPSPRTDPPPRR
jgi:uncharacterized protein (TIGR02246 family)